MGEFSPPPFGPFFLFFSYPSNIEIIFDFSDIITKIHPSPFQNPGSALGPHLYRMANTNTITIQVPQVFTYTSSVEHCIW